MSKKIEQLYENSLKGVEEIVNIDGTNLKVSLALAKGNKLNGCLSVFKLGKRFKNIIIKGSSKEDFISKIETYYNNEPMEYIKTNN